MPEEIVNINFENREKKIFLTPKLIGFLDALIIESNKVLSTIRLELEEYPGIILYENSGFVGTEYFPLRIRPVDSRGDGFNYTNTKYVLYDKIKITIDAQEGAKIKIVFLD